MAPPDRWATARTAALVATLAAAAVALLAGGAAAAGRSPGVVRWLNARQATLYEADRATWEETGIFESFEERLWHEELPALPAGEPLLGLLGGSNVKQSLDRADFPPELAARLHVIAVGGCTATSLERLVATLDAQKGALRPGSRLVLGGWWGLLSEREQLARDFLVGPAEGHGVWRAGPQGFEPTGGPLRGARLELARLRALRRALQDRLTRPPGPLPPTPGAPTPGLLAERVGALVAAYGPIRIPGPQTAALERTVDRIVASGATLVLLEMPAPTWLRARPEAAAWRAWSAGLSARRALRRVDLEAALPDADFHGDYTLHPRREGRRRLQSRLAHALGGGA